MPRGTRKPEAQTWALTGQAAWTWSRWNIHSNELTPLAELPAATADTFWFRIDGDVYASETEPDYSETTLMNLTAEAGPTRALTVPGFLQNIARIR